MESEDRVLTLRQYVELNRSILVLLASAHHGLTNLPEGEMREQTLALHQQAAEAIGSTLQFA
jgi:hypothetical protein